MLGYGSYTTSLFSVSTSIPTRIEIQEFRDLSAFTRIFRIVTKGGEALLIVAPITPSRCTG
jgi:hypothetical protein